MGLPFWGSSIGFFRVYLYDLVVHHAVGKGHVGEERQQVGGYLVAVDRGLRVGLHHARQVYLVDVNEREGANHAVADAQALVRCLEVGHGKRAAPELERHEAVAVFVHLRLCEFPVPYAPFGENVIHLCNLVVEVHRTCRGDIPGH